MASFVYVIGCYLASIAVGEMCGDINLGYFIFGISLVILAMIWAIISQAEEKKERELKDK